MTNSYQWDQDGTPIGGATNPTYAPQAGDVGHMIGLTVFDGQNSYSATPVGPVTATPPPAPAVGQTTPSGQFPIGVWFQSVSDAAAYAAIGINVYSFLADTPNQALLNTLKQHGIYALIQSSYQSQVLALSDLSAFWGWFYPIDEPDNAQQTSSCHGDCPCVLPSTVNSQMQSIKAADPAHRQVALECGECMGMPSLPDRGSVCSSPDNATAAARDYPIYFQHADFAFEDIYPVNHGYPFTIVADAADHLLSWASSSKTRCHVLETTRINSNQGLPTPTQTRCETWLALIHQATMIQYFAHTISPFQQNALVANSAYTSMKNQIAATNAQVQRLAGPLLTANVGGALTVSGNSSRIDACIRDFGGHRYLFATAPNGATSATFTIAGGGTSAVTVIDEGRTRPMAGGVFTDTFNQYDVHLYQIS